LHVRGRKKNPSTIGREPSKPLILGKAQTGGERACGERVYRARNKPGIQKEKKDCTPLTKSVAGKRFTERATGMRKKGGERRRNSKMQPKKEGRLGEGESGKEEKALARKGTRIKRRGRREKKRKSKRKQNPKVKRGTPLGEKNRKPVKYRS